MSELPKDLRVIRHPNARRMKLRLDRRDGAPVLVLPPCASLKAGRAFVAEHLDWIKSRQAEHPTGQPFTDGVAFPMLDANITIRHESGRRLGVRRCGDLLWVSGTASHVNRRVTDWLKREARRELSVRARGHAAAIGAAVKTIRIADQKSRWGSCAAGGVLSFNWRLILTPESVLDYVAAHEATHLQEMNHGPAFHWLLARLHPDPDGARRWLKENGSGLRAWGQA